MSQAEVLEILKSHPKKWYTIKSMASILKIQEASVCTNIRKLRKCSFIKLRIGTDRHRTLYVKHKSEREMII